MFNDNNYVNSSYQHYNNQYEYQERPAQNQMSFPVAQTSLYQEDINKCLSVVNSDYNSYDASFNYDSAYLSTFHDTSARDSGIAADLEKNSTNGAEKKLHIHQSRFDQDECQQCRNTTIYLLSAPFINYFDYKFAAANSSKISLSSDETNYVEYKLLTDFKFATPKKLMLKDSPNCYFISPSQFVENLHYIQSEFELNGRTIDNMERLMQREEEMQRLYPMTQHYDYKNELYSFSPNANSTPAKFLFNQQQQFYHVNSNNQYSMPNNFSWKKPLVLDPRLSAQYDAVFPSLDVSSNNYSYDDQPTNVNAMDNLKFYYCVFCKNNNESPDIYKSHILRDFTGRICCPTLRKYKCPICGAFGDKGNVSFRLVNFLIKRAKVDASMLIILNNIIQYKDFNSQFTFEF